MKMYDTPVNDLVCVDLPINDLICVDLPMNGRVAESCSLGQQEVGAMTREEDRHLRYAALLCRIKPTQKV